MKFVADECCDASLVKKLRELGYDVTFIVEENPGITDSQVLAGAFAGNRILITEDKDFGELVYRLKKETKGIVLLRFPPTEHELKWQRLKEIVQRDDITLMDKFITVDVEKFRIRSLK